MTIDNQHELDALLRSGRLAAQILNEVLAMVEPGVRTIDLDREAKKLMDAAGARSAPIVTYDFPGATCISVNEEIAHGIPGDRLIEEGDVVNIDVSLELGGYFADNAATMIVGNAPESLHVLCDAAKQARDEAIEKIRPGMKLNMMGRIFQKHAKRIGAKVIKDLGSHGIGRKLHEAPEQIAGFYDRKDKRRFKPYQVLTVEPFISNGASLTRTALDEWTLLNTPNTYSAQFEHTILVRPNDVPLILTRC